MAQAVKPSHFTRGAEARQELRAVAFGIRSDAQREGTALTPSADAEGRVRLRDPGLGISENVAPTIDSGQPHAVAFDCKATEINAAVDGASQTLRSMSHSGSHANAGSHAAVAFDTTQITSPGNYSNPQPGDPCHPLASTADVPAIATPWAVRRLTPLECQRLQGFPDDYFDGLNLADGPKFKMLGNSMAVNVMRWIGERIDTVNKLKPLV